MITLQQIKDNNPCKSDLKKGAHGPNLAKSAAQETSMLRCLNPSLYSGITVTNVSMTVMLWNLSGQLVGYQTYRPDLPKTRGNNAREQRYFTYLPKGTQSAFGLELLDSSQKVCFIVEGVFDAVHLHNRGVNCLAVLGSDPKQLKNLLNCLPYETIGLIEDDEGGRRLAKYVDNVLYMPKGKDPWDMPQTWYDDMLGLVNRLAARLLV